MPEACPEFFGGPFQKWTVCCLYGLYVYAKTHFVPEKGSEVIYSEAKHESPWPGNTDLGDSKLLVSM